MSKINEKNDGQSPGNIDGINPDELQRPFIHQLPGESYRREVTAEIRGKLSVLYRHASTEAKNTFNERARTLDTAGGDLVVGAQHTVPSLRLLPDAASV